MVQRIGENDLKLSLQSNLSSIENHKASLPHFIEDAMSATRAPDSILWSMLKIMSKLHTAGLLTVTPAQQAQIY
jgi:hypothetical protein